MCVHFYSGEVTHPILSHKNLWASKNRRLRKLGTDKMSSLFKHVKTLQVCKTQIGSHTTSTRTHARTRAHDGWVYVRTSCPQLLRRPSRCVRARPPKVNGRMTLWWLEEGKVLHFTALEFYFICWHVWPASFWGGCCMSLGLSGLFIMPSKRREPLPLCRSRYTSRPVSF